MHSWHTGCQWQQVWSSFRYYPTIVFLLDSTKLEFTKPKTFFYLNFLLMLKMQSASHYRFKLVYHCCHSEKDVEAGI